MKPAHFHSFPSGFARLQNATATRGRFRRISYFLNAFSFSIQALLINAALFTLIMFGLYGAAVALEHGTGPDALPTAFWIVAGVAILLPSIRSGMRKARQHAND